MNDLHVIIGTGPLGRYTAESLLQQGYKVKLINRSGEMLSPPKGAELIRANVLALGKNPILFSGARTIYQCAQPAYHRWKKEFPALQDAVLSIAIAQQAKLVAAENLYMYGNTHGQPMHENTPYKPCSEKGTVRMHMTQRLQEAHEKGWVRVARVRGSDFFGPWEPINGKMIFKAALQKKTLYMPGKLNQPHTFTYVKDFGKTLAVAGTEDRAMGKIWHVPSGKPFTQNELAGMLAQILGVQVKTRATGKLMLSLVGLFNKPAGEMAEMLYQFNEPFILQSDAMEQTFGLAATPMAQRLEETIDWVKTHIL